MARRKQTCGFDRPKEYAYLLVPESCRVDAGARPKRSQGSPLLYSLCFRSCKQLLHPGFLGVVVIAQV